MAFFPSREQKNIKEYIESENSLGKNVSVNVKAPAGSGKSSSILYLLETFTQNSKCLYLVFNGEMRKEMEQRLNFTNSPFDINTSNLEQFTFHGFIRSEIKKLISGIDFDFVNGEFSNHHFKKLFEIFNLKLSDDEKLIKLVESYNKFLSPFLKDTMNLETFFDLNREKQILLNQDSFSLVHRLSKVMNVLPSSLSGKDTFSNQEVEEITRNVYFKLTDDIFNARLLQNIMPHSVYYKYADLHFSNINLFKNYDYVFVDEAQDIDKIIMSLLEKGNANLIKLGDTFQKINGFRGTVNSLEDRPNIKTFFLSDSYRLTPYLGLLAEAFLKTEGAKYGNELKDIPSIYGYSKSELNLEKSRIKEQKRSDFFKDIIDNFSTVNIYDSHVFHDANRHKKQITESILDGKKTEFERAIKKFNKDKNYVEFYLVLSDITTLYSKDSEAIKDKKIISLTSKDDIDLIKELNKIARDYTFNLTKKEMREILSSDSGTYGFIARNNNKAIDTVYNLVKNIPQEQLGEIPLFNIKFALSTADVYDSLIKNNFGLLKAREVREFNENLNSITCKDFPSKKVSQLLNIVSGEDDKLDNESERAKAREEILNKVLTKLLKDSSSCIAFAEVPMFLVENKKVSFSDLGVKGVDIKGIVDNAIKQIKSYKTKNHDTSEITVNDMKKIARLNSFDKLAPLDKLLRKQIDVEFFDSNKSMTLLENFYKYSHIKDIVKNNPNIELVKNSAYYNIFVSTTHQSKGLEFDNVMIANDVYVLDGKNKEMDFGIDESLEQDNSISKELEEEFNLAYVALTRTKGTISLEENSPLVKIMNNLQEVGYKRYFSNKNKDILVVEQLSDKQNSGLPTFEIIKKDSYGLKTDREKSFLMNSTFYPNVKKMQFAYNPSKNDLKILDDSLDEKKKIEYIDSGYTLEHLSKLDATQEEFNAILQEWEQEYKQKEEEIKVGLENNVYGF